MKEKYDNQVKGHRLPPGQGSSTSAAKVWKAGGASGSSVGRVLETVLKTIYLKIIYLLNIYHYQKIPPTSNLFRLHHSIKSKMYSICSSSIYGFWLPLWYLQTLLSNVFFIFGGCHDCMIVGFTTSFIGGGNWSIRKKPSTCCKSLTKFIT
jgi:hypothetical protein